MNATDMKQILDKQQDAVNSAFEAFKNVVWYGDGRMDEKEKAMANDLVKAFRSEHRVIGEPAIDAIPVHYGNVTHWIKKSDITILDPVYIGDGDKLMRTYIAGHNDKGVIEVRCRESIPCILGMLLHHDPAYYVLGLHSRRKSLMIAKELADAINFYAKIV